MKPYSILLFVKAITYLFTDCPTATPASAAFYESLKPTNVIILSKTPIINKSKNAYKIPILNKNFITLKDSGNIFHEDEGTVFKYLGYTNVLNGYFFLKKSNENYAYFFISTKGFTTKFRDYPFVSNDKNKVIVLSRGIENSMFLNTLEVFSINNGNIKKRCEIKISKIEPEEIRWITNSDFVLKSHKVTTDGLPLKKYMYTKYHFQ